MRSLLLVAVVFLFSCGAASARPFIGHSSPVHRCLRLDGYGFNSPVDVTAIADFKYGRKGDVSGLFRYGTKQTFSRVSGRWSVLDSDYLVDVVQFSPMPEVVSSGDIRWPTGFLKLTFGASGIGKWTQFNVSGDTDSSIAFAAVQSGSLSPVQCPR